METLVVVMGLLGLASNQLKNPAQYHPQPVQQYYNPQTGKYYIYHQGYMYEQNVPQNQGYQNQPTQNLATPNWTPQPPNGQWYPQQPAQTATYPQGFYR
jgi:hypothetical protein